MKRILALALLAALPAVGFAQTSAKTSPSAATTKSPATSTTKSTSSSTTTASSPATTSKATTTTTTSASPATAASSPAAGATSRTDVYHVHFTHAAPGKGMALGDSLKKPDPTAPMPGHLIVLRHSHGDSWDYCVIEHMGTKASVEATRPPIPAADRDLSDWHNDTFVSGPAWADFAKAMGINEGAGKSAVYIVSNHRTLPGHREQLDAELNSTTADDPVAGHVVLQHLEGGAWTFLDVSRYATWQDFLKSEEASAADMAKGGGGWAKVREHSSNHTDTLCDRVSP